MHFRFCIYCFFLLQCICGYGQDNIVTPVDRVNSFIGTTGASSTEYGGLIPAVAPPFAMTQWCAVTRENGIGRTVYHYNDKSIMGFIGSHQPAIWMGDYGMVTICPGVGTVYTDARRAMQFSHDEEKATPYGYSVTLHTKQDQQIKAAMGASCRAGILSFSFPATDSAYVYVEASRQENFVGWIKYDSIRGELVGYNPDRQSAHLGPPLPGFKGYFVVRFNKAPSAFGMTYHEVVFPNQKEQAGDRCGAYLQFKTAANERIMVKVGTSFISIDQARQNLDKEIPAWDVTSVQHNTRDTWNRYLNTIRVEGGDKDQQTCFYTALYRTMQYPREFSEYGRYYSAFDDKVHDGVSYNDYSLWDTYRAEHPLLDVVMPERSGAMVKSLLQMYKEGGWLPKWPNPTYSNIMIGTHADAVIADAIAKGIKGFDLQTAWNAVKKDAFTFPKGDSMNRWADRAPWTFYEARAGLTWYDKLGYIPLERTRESVSQTIEYAYDDWCVAQVAKASGHLKEYDLLIKRSKNYKNLYEARSGFMIARYGNGSFVAPAKSMNEGLTEGGKWTYLFGPMHDIPGLINLMGGPSAFEKKLDENFDSLHYRHDNEPGHHFVYLYDYIGKPEKTQERIYQNTPINYRNAPDGLTGNDDCGQMSAWLVFTSMGFYPVCPGSEDYAVGVPLFDSIQLTVQPPGQKAHSLLIRRNNYSQDHRHVKEIRIDGKKLERPFFTHRELLKAKEIVFEMM